MASGHKTGDKITEQMHRTRDCFEIEFVQRAEQRLGEPSATDGCDEPRSFDQHSGECSERDQDQLLP